MYKTFSRAIVLACVYFSAVNTDAADLPTNGRVVVQRDASDAWTAGGGVFALGTDLEIDNNRTDSSDVGVVAFPFSSEVVFDATSAQISVDFTIGDENTLALFDILLLDFDGAQTDVFSELHIYQIPLSGLEANVRHSVTLPLIANGPPGVPGTQPFFSFAIGPVPDSMVNFDGNGGLGELALGFSSFSDDRVQMTLHDIRIVAIPEPAGCALWIVGTTLLLSQRRR